MYFITQFLQYATWVGNAFCLGTTEGMVIIGLLGVLAYSMVIK